jgi:flagellar hook-associated protein 2
MSTVSSTTSALNITGLVSDTDWQALAEEIVEAQKTAAVSPLETRLTLQENTLSTWQSFNTTLSYITNYIETNDLDDDAGYESYTANLTCADASITATNILSASTGTGTVTAGSYEIVVSQLAQAEKIRSDVQASSSTALGYDGEITVNGTSITIEADDTLEDIADRINDADAGVTASVLKASDSEYYLTLEASDTGSTGITVVDDGVSNILESLGVLSGTEEKNVIRAGSDATLTIDGVSVTSSSNTITGVIEGVALTLNSTNTVDSAITLTIEQSTDDLSSGLATLVDYINDTLSFIKDQNTYNEDSETANILMGNSTLSGIKRTITSILQGTIEGNETYTSAKSIGISFESGGTLTLDPDTLAAALSENPDEVIAAMKSLSSSLYEALDVYVDPTTGTLASIQDAIESRIDNIEDRIEDIESRYARKAEVLQARYAALQTLISESDIISSYLEQLVDSWSSSD